MLKLPILLEAPNNKFKKRASKFPPQVQENIKDVARELEDGEVPNGRDLKSVSGYDNVYSMRLTGNFRVAIEVTGEGTGRMFYAESRESFYDYLNRRK